MTAPNPYVGPRPFERADSNLFFGRTQEANELLSLIVANRAVVLYAPSGAGKTSLLNALVIPLLEKEGDLQVYPFARVRGPLPAGLDPAEITNLYVFHSLLSWCGTAAAPKTLANQTIAQFLTNPPQAKAETAAGEGILSLGEFLTTPEPAFDGEEGLPPARVLVFDQFEELFTTYPERWRDREGLFNQLERALHDDPLLRVVFSLREDYVAQLDPYASLMPKNLRTRFRLERMRPDAALAAIRNPLQGTGRQFAPGAAEQLVEDLRKVRVQSATGETVAVTGEFVEPVQLQVVCQNLWQDLPAGITTITQVHLKTYGNVTQALSRFYERAIGQTVQATNLQEPILRDWFAHTLITPAGTRGTVYRGQTDTGGIPNPAIDLLENLHIIRGEWRAGARWYELTHDRLIEPIQKSNESWREKQRQQQRRRIITWLGGAGTIIVAALCLAFLYITYSTLAFGGQTASAYDSGRLTAEAEAAMSGTAAAEGTSLAATATRQLEATGAVATSQAVGRETLVAVATRQAEAAAIATQTAQVIDFPTTTPAPNETRLPPTPTVASVEYLLGQTGFFPILTANQRLTLLAQLFDLGQGQQDDYDLLARELFYNLSAAEQTNLFAAQANPPAVEAQLLTTIRGILPALGHQPGNQDAVLISAMNGTLVDADPANNKELQEELAQWAAGRQALIEGNAEQALTAFGRAIALDGTNPALYYNRAVAFAAAGRATEAATDLEFMLQLAFNPGQDTAALINSIPSAQQVIGGFITPDQMLEQAGQVVCDHPPLRRQLINSQASYPLLLQSNVLQPFAFIHRPLDSTSITQRFGDNPAAYQQFGLPGHNGLDFAAANGSSVYAVADGRVEIVDSGLGHSLYGVYVKVRHQYNCEIYYTIYAHLDQAYVFEGEWLPAGNSIGLSGSTGNTNGPTLHLGLQQEGVTIGNWPNNLIDPEPFLSPNQQFQTAP